MPVHSTPYLTGRLIQGDNHCYISPIRLDARVPSLSLDSGGGDTRLPSYRAVKVNRPLFCPIT